MNRYLVLIHLASKPSREKGMSELGPTLISAIRGALDDCETILTAPQALGVCGLSAKPPREIWDSLRVLLRAEDNISVVAVGADVVTSHPGFADWDGRTRWMTRRDSGRPT